METPTAIKVSAQINVVQLAFKKVNNYTSIEMLLHFALNSGNKEYWVIRKGKAVYKGSDFYQACDTFDKYKDNKDLFLTPTT